MKGNSDEESLEESCSELLCTAVPAAAVGDINSESDGEGYIEGCCDVLCCQNGKMAYQPSDNAYLKGLAKEGQTLQPTWYKKYVSLADSLPTKAKCILCLL